MSEFAELSAVIDRRYSWLVSLERFRYVEPKDGVPGLVGNHDVFALRIDGNAASILKQLAGSADGQPGRHISVVEDAPNADVIIQLVSARDVSFRTPRVSGPDDGEDHSLLGI